MFYQKQIDKDVISKFKSISLEIYPDCRESFMSKYKYFSHFVEIALAVVSKTLNRESNLMKVLKFAWYAPFFLLFKSKRETQFQSFVTSGDLDLNLKIVKASGNNFSRFCFYILNPSIKFHQKIYVPKSYDRMTVEDLTK